MRRQLIRLRSNIGTLHVQFDWDGNIGINGSQWINSNSIEFCSDSDKQMMELLAYAIGDGETPKEGMEYKLYELVYDWGKDWSWWNDTEDAPTGEFVVATIECIETYAIA